MGSSELPDPCNDETGMPTATGKTPKAEGGRGKGTGVGRMGQWRQGREQTGPGKGTGSAAVSTRTYDSNITDFCYFT